MINAAHLIWIIPVAEIVGALMTILFVIVVKDEIDNEQ